MPTEQSLALLAPDKKRDDTIQPMKYLKAAIEKHDDEKKTLKKVPAFAPAGQSTQMVIGATPENDLQVLWMEDQFYKKMKLRRVYYSGYVPISNDKPLTCNRHTCTYDPRKPFVPGRLADAILRL